MKVYNPKTKKNQDLFETETLCPVFTVCCTNDEVVNGYKGAAVYLNVEACDKEEAIKKALLNKEFTQHLTKNFNKDRDLTVYTPSGLYVIGRVDYFDGDPRL